MTTFIKRILATVTVIVFVFAMLPISALADVDSGNMGLQIGADAPGVDIVLRRTKDLGSGEIWDGGIAENFAGGSGTEDDPYLISNGAELAYLADIIDDPNTDENPSHGRYYKLTADIYLNDTADWENWGTEDANGDIIAPANEWTAIGSTRRFAGTLDGDGHAVFGVYINEPGKDYQGLFSYNNGTIANLSVMDSYICGDAYVGGIAGNSSSGTMINCYNGGTVDGGNYVGGISGYGYFISCSNVGTVSGYNYVGGVAGYNQGRSIYCYNLGAVSGNQSVGGVTGHSNSYGNMIHCYNLGAVSGVDYVGGITGENVSNVVNCYNMGTVTGSSNFGGITGYNSSGNNSFGCYYLDTACPSGNSYGVALSDEQMQSAENFVDFDFNNVWAIEPDTGYSYPQLMKDLDPSYGGDSAVWDGNIAEGFASGTGTENDPYIIETTDQLAYFANSVNGGTSYAGNYIRLANDIQLNDYNAKYWILNATPWIPIGTSENVFEGNFDGDGHVVSGIYISMDASSSSKGLFGRNYGDISNIGVIDSFICGNGAAGGVVGSNNGDIANCYNTGTIMGRYSVGGVVGGHRGATITNCYNAGTVEGQSSVGGVLGGNSAESMDNISGCYNTGIIIGCENTGGVIGNFEGDITDCYNTGTVIGILYTGGVVGNHYGDMTNCYNTGAVEGRHSVGGVSGLAYRIISNCYNTGTVTGDSNIGGIVGEHYDRVIACYNIGTVSGNESFGPIAGLDDGDQDEEIEIDCYYLDTCCPFGSSSGTALTDEQMQDAENFAGLDFETVWTMEGNPEYPYPELRSNPHFIYPDEPGILGDFDGDGEITAIDAVNILRVALGILNGDGNINADYDCDGEITALDAIKVLRVALGLVEGNELYSYPEALWQ